MFLLLLYSTAAAASPVVVETTLTHNSISVGDQVVLRITVTHDPQARIEFPDLYDKLNGLELIRRHQLPSRRPSEVTQVSITEYTITGFVPGQYRLPPVLVQYTLPDGTRGSVPADNDLRLEIGRIVSDPDHQALLDIKPPGALPRPAVALLYPAAGGALLLSMAILLALTTRRLMRPMASVPAALLDPIEQARRDLASTATLPLATPGDYVTYYTGISATIRRYLDARFQFDAMASTTKEIRGTMEQRGMDRWQARVVSGLLEQCDSVKWAHYVPDGARAKRALSMALEVIELTCAHDSPLAPALPGTRNGNGTPTL